MAWEAFVDRLKAILKIGTASFKNNISIIRK
jgi:hypothetical protein